MGGPAGCGGAPLQPTAPFNTPGPVEDPHTCREVGMHHSTPPSESVRGPLGGRAGRSPNLNVTNSEGRAGRPPAKAPRTEASRGANQAHLPRPQRRGLGRVCPPAAPAPEAAYRPPAAPPGKEMPTGRRGRGRPRDSPRRPPASSGGPRTRGRRSAHPADRSPRRAGPGATTAPPGGCSASPPFRPSRGRKGRARPPPGPGPTGPRTRSRSAQPAGRARPGRQEAAGARGRRPRRPAAQPWRPETWRWPAARAPEPAWADYEPHKAARLQTRAHGRGLRLGTNSAA